MSHASAFNLSDLRRIGLAINYSSTENRQIVAQKDFAMLVRGVDNHHHLEHIPAPQADMSTSAMAWHNKILSTKNDAIYKGVPKASN